MRMLHFYERREKSDFPDRRHDYGDESTVTDLKRLRLLCFWRRTVDGRTSLGRSSPISSLLPRCTTPRGDIDTNPLGNNEIPSSSKRNTRVRYKRIFPFYNHTQHARYRALCVYGKPWALFDDVSVPPPAARQRRAQTVASGGAVTATGVS